MEDPRIKLYQEMADHTKAECASCARPHSCCDDLYCEWAIKYAQEEFGVTLERTGHPRLPLMGPEGCTAAPHLRPICTVHTCDIAGLGFKRGDPEWTKRYFELRDKIEGLEDLEDFKV